MKNYLPANISFTYGEGCWLYDKNNKKYLDALCGVAVTNLGHNHPTITKTICEQSKKLLHTSNWFIIDNQEKLAEKLCAITNMSSAYFANSGAEANEAAIKLTRLYASENNIKNPIILTTNNSFHGRSMACISASGKKEVKEGYNPLLPGFIHIEFNNIEAIKKYSNNSNVVAVMLEPIQGEAGVIIPDNNYLNDVRQICDKNNWLMILDEIQTGMGRTGKWFAYQHYGIYPDILTSSKALGNGIPIASCLAKEGIGNLFSAGKHGSTFGGNPFSTAVALSVIETIENEDLLTKCQIISSYLEKSLRQKLENNINVKQIRIKGLMIGIELTSTCTFLFEKAIENNLLINIAVEKIIRILPPLTLNKLEADILVEKIIQLINYYAKKISSN